LKKPYSPFLINAGFVVRILPRHVWEKVSDPFVFHSKDATIGCGPYVFDSFENSSGICRFHLNSEYYGRKATVEHIEFRLFKSMDVLTLALKKKQIHAFYKYASGFPAPYMRAIESQPGLSFLSVESMGVPAVLGFNFDRSFLQRVNIRRAISLALDYKRFNLCLMDGKGRLPGAGFVPPVFPSQAKLPTLRQSVERSREILTAEGFIDRDHDGFLESEDGKTIDLALLARSDLWGDGQIVKLLAANMAKVGIRLSVQSVDLSTWQSLLRQGRYDLVLFRTTPWGMMMHAGYGSGYFDSRKAGSINICRLNDDNFFTICDQILDCTDPKTLKDLHRKLQVYYAGQLPALALCWGKSFFPFAKEWQGFQVNQLEGGLANRFSWSTLEFHAPRGKEKR
jgi:peptide/nickel transport system substrate-binding protein